MDTDYFLSVSLLVLSILFSALFSGAEVSLFSLTNNDLKEMKKERGIIPEYILVLIKNQRRLLVTILVGNTLSNVGASIIAVTLALKIAAVYQIPVDFMLVLQIVILTVLILFFGEITPKVFAAKHPVRFTRIIIIPLYWVNVILYPITKTLSDFIKSFLGKMKMNKSGTAIKSTEITDLADLSVEAGTIEVDEHELIHGLVSFKTISAKEVMTPRVDVTAVPKDISFDDLMNIITQSGHSRIPVYQDNLDNIVGILYAKDLLPFMGEDAEHELNLMSLTRPAEFFPATKHINELLHEFQKTKIHIGIVVDEYGGTMGIITLEDILEEIVGEIRDEYDKEEQEITKIGDNEFIVLGKTPIDELKEELNLDLETDEEDFDTVGGFIYFHTGNIPEKGYSFNFGGFNFTIEQVENQRISRVRLKKLNSDNE